MTSDLPDRFQIFTTSDPILISSRQWAREARRLATPLTIVHQKALIQGSLHGSVVHQSFNSHTELDPYGCHTSVQIAHAAFCNQAMYLLSALLNWS